MECIACGTEEDLFFRCSYCDGAYCREHRLPEGHDCDGVRFLSDSGKRFESKFSGDIVKEGEGIESPKPFKPKFTVGTTTEPEWDPSPDTVLKSEVESDEEYSSVGLVRRFRRLFDRLL